MRISSQGLVTNPIREILEALPYTESVLDPSLADTLLLIMLKHKYTPTNCILMLLLAKLKDAGLVTITKLQMPSILGTVVLVKRNI